MAFSYHQHWVTPESKHDILPRHDAVMGLTLTASARLDNREDLYNRFGFSPTAVALTDSQLILHAYAKWGTACPDYLLGDFAFAIWDARQQQLFCARDLFGVTPFFYCQDATQFWFASTLEAIGAAAGGSHEIDYAYLAAYLRSGTSPPYSERTWYTKVARLLPAHAMTVSAAGVRIWTYWRPEQVPALPPDSETGYIERLAYLFRQAVSCRTRSAYAVGVHLSGGLDSSGVAALASRQTRQHGMACTAFSWSPPLESQRHLDGDERALVEAVRVAERIPCHYAPGTLYDLADSKLRPLHLPDRRFFPESQVRRLAHDQGIRVMLSGWGGDELAAFNGRGYLADLWRRGRWRTLWRECAAYAQQRGSRTGQILRGKGLLPSISDRLLPFATRSALPPYVKQRGALALPGLLRPDVAAQLRAADPGPPKQLRRERPGVRRNQLELLAHGHLTTRAEWWATDAPEQGIVYRYPMLDRRLVEFSLGLPPQLYFQGGWSRYILRRTLEGMVPRRVQWNWQKAESARNAYLETTGRAFRQQVLKPLMAEVLSGYESFDSLDTVRIHEMVRKLVANPEDHSSLLGFALPLRVEMMMNQPLAQDVQAWLSEWRHKHDNDVFFSLR
ncbi:asparagine synthase-related protein [Candidatus Entotheonella palauensis]|uniref:asparagine synthase-related protein n=1 Tax=Candidatus Entotheonella palauensis TaxID=93172 RepID=UPI0015C4E7AE|nr:asparagine synthase-related protein [Candidatus Entotheonella palauensis]